MKKKYLTPIALTLLIIAPIDSLRNLPLAALFGPSLLFFLFFGALLFLIPVALTSAQLASSLPGKGGIYHWVSLGLGEKAGMMAVWLQWINTLIWFPTVLAFIAGTAAYFFRPELASSKTYLVSSVLVVFWIMTLFNLRGVHRSISFGNLFFLVGFVLPVVILLICALYWLYLGYPSYLHFDAGHLIPHLGRSSNWISLTAIITSFLGIELAAVHVNEVQYPEKTFPKALMVAVVGVILSIGVGALSIALVIPATEIKLVDGVMQVFSFFLRSYHLSWAIPLIVFLVIIGCLGAMVSWIISPAKGLLQAAESGFLPDFFLQKNNYGVPQNLLLTQALLVSLICLAFELMPSVNGSYWFLCDLSTELYLLVYALMFFAAWQLYPHIEKQNSEHFRIPGKSLGTKLVVLMGLLGCLIPFVVGFVPPEAIDVGGWWHYEFIFSLGVLVITGCVLFFYWHKRCYQKKAH